MIAIVDYGMGNLMSVQKAVESQGFKALITNKPEEVMQADGVILPGVGAFPDAMDNLQSRGLVEAIRAVAAGGTPLLGICLGMQLMLEVGLEMEERRGLGLFKGRVERIPPGVKVPHMGWNSLDIWKDCPLLEGLETGDYVYFVHSYYGVNLEQDAVCASCYYGVKVPAVISKGNIFGVQFHPEKSGEKGLMLYKNFGELVMW